MSVARYLQAAPEDDGMHALRHAYASVLLEAGESINALSETRTRKAIDDAFTETPEPEAQGTSVPPEKPMCPQCALAA